MEWIERFSGEHRFLSNFYPSRVKMDGLEYPTVEHAYQAMKTKDAFDRIAIRDCKTPTEAKRRGQRVKLRSDWESVKLSVMEELLRQKFKDPHLKKLLLDTGDAKLIECNDWNDRFWGVCNGSGQNHLGRLLMKIRSELQDE